MLKVFIASHPTEAHLVKGILEADGIAAVIRGEPLFALRGEAPVTPDTLPSVWVADEDVARALELLADFRTTDAGPARAELQWVCRGCGERVDATFDLCWNCGGGR